MCVFTLSCFLAKFVIVVRYIKVCKGEKFQDVRSRNVFKNSFYLQHGKCSLCLCCKRRRNVCELRDEMEIG